MKLEEIREYLDTAYYISKEVESLEAAVAEMNDIAGLHGSNLEHDHVGSTKDPHATMDNVAILTERLYDRIREKNRAVAEVIEVINSVPSPLYRGILIDHYVTRMTWDEVWIKWNYAPGSGHTREMQRRAELAAGEALTRKKKRRP